MLIPVALATLALQGAPAEAPAIPPHLRAAFAERAPETVYPVYAVLRERLRRADFAGRVEGLPREERRRFVADTLRAFADARQGDVRALLAGLEARGEVERVRPLWVTNSVIFHGTRGAIEAVAALPEIERIGWSGERPAEAAWDVVGTTTYYSQNFEDGLFVPPEFETTASGCGFALVLPTFEPQGNFHLLLASGTDDCESTASATLTVDLSRATTAQLRFFFKDLDDEFDPGEDILEASDDGGASWVKVDDLIGVDGLYVVKEYDLDPLGLDYVEGFKIRWSWSDNFSAPTDGFAIDEIEIADELEPIEPPEPEVNLVELQAPLLWDHGFDGTDISILNIDSGVDDSHPDLENRIWTNPLDPIDGLDNDGNGYVDDHKGWDFVGDDNDPDPAGAIHGTNTAGILVGDGSGNQFLTGMAPGATMAVARIDGEMNHWEAQQWGISVGIDCISSSHSYKWYFDPPPDYHMHREVSDMVLAAGIPHANSIGNDGSQTIAPIPFNISAPGLSPAPWRHTVQDPLGGGISGVLACGAIELDDSLYSNSGIGPSAWEDLALYEPTYPHDQNPDYWDYPVGGFGGGLPGVVKPDIVTYTHVTTTTLDGGYFAQFGGTSAATPHLGGALALLLDAQPHAAPRHVAQAVQVSAEDLGVLGKDVRFGAGKLQVFDAAKRLFHLVRARNVAPEPGATVHLDYFGAPNQHFRGFYSLEGYGATPLGTVGSLDLAPPVFGLVAGTLDHSGHSALQATIPNNPAFSGLEVYLQSVADDRAGATGEVLFSVVEQVSVQ